MTNEEIIKIAVPMLAAVLSGFSKSIFDKILAEYKPDIKKIKSRILFLVLILIRFIIPFIVLIMLYFKTVTIDKIFVVSFSTILFVLIFNIFYDIFVRYVDKKHEKQIEFQISTLALFTKIIEKGSETDDKITTLYDLTSKHIDITSKLFDNQTPTP